MSFRASLAGLALVLLPACAGGPVPASDFGFSATGSMKLDHGDPAAETLLGRIHVTSAGQVDGVLALASLGAPVAVHGTVHGSGLAFSNTRLFAGGGNGAVDYEATQLTLTPDLAPDGTLRAVAVDVSGTFTSLGGDLANTGTFTGSLSGGLDVDGAGLQSPIPADRPLVPTDPLDLVFLEPVEIAGVVSAAFDVHTSDGTQVPVTVAPRFATLGYATRVTLTPATFWPFGAPLIIAPGHAPVTGLGRAIWKSPLHQLGPNAGTGTLKPTSFEDGKAAAFTSTDGATPMVLVLQPPLATDGTHAMRVPEGAAWAKLSLPQGATALTLRVTYLVSGDDPGNQQPPEVTQALGWAAHVASAAGVVGIDHGVAGVSFTSLGGVPVVTYAGPSEIVTLDVHKLAGTEAVLVLNARGFSMPPSLLTGALLVDSVAF